VLLTAISLSTGNEHEDEHEFPEPGGLFEMTRAARWPITRHPDNRYCFANNNPHAEKAVFRTRRWCS
jgi:hypothetical protein